MVEVEYPWQRLPASLIAYAEEHAQRQSEFDHQVAFLLLDVGVETLLNVYRTMPENIKQARRIEHTLTKNTNAPVQAIETPSEKANFHLLIDIVKELAGEKLAGINLNEVEYYHSIRNKLYHQGDGVTATAYNLSEYVKISKQLLKALIAVDLDILAVPEVQDTIIEFGPDSFFVVRGIIDEDRISSFLDMTKDASAAFRKLKREAGEATRYLRPLYTSRKFEGERKRILREHGDDKHTDYTERAKQQQIRGKLFAELTGKELPDLDLVDLILKDPSIAWCFVVFSELFEDWRHQREMFWAVVDFIEESSKVQYTFVKNDPQKVPLSEVTNAEEIYTRYKETMSWIEKTRAKISAYIEEQEDRILANRIDASTSG